MTSFTKNTISNAADWLTTSLNADNTSMDGYPEIDKITGSQAGSQYLFQLDYTKPINDSTKIEMGIRSFNYTRDIQYLFNKKNNDTYTLLEGYSQDGVIKESVNAAYFMYSTKLKRNYSIQEVYDLKNHFCMVIQDLMAQLLDMIIQAHKTETG
jgi:hypothetical protein